MFEVTFLEQFLQACRVYVVNLPSEQLNGQTFSMANGILVISLTLNKYFLSQHFI